MNDAILEQISMIFYLLNTVRSEVALNYAFIFICLVFFFFRSLMDTISKRVWREARNLRFEISPLWSEFPIWLGKWVQIQRLELVEVVSWGGISDRSEEKERGGRGVKGNIVIGNVELVWNSSGISESKRRSDLSIRIVFLGVVSKVRNSILVEERTIAWKFRIIEKVEIRLP